MATLVLSAVGTMFGGPLGGAIGALIGRQVDSRLLAPSQKGPRLKELTVTTSSYGMAIPRHFGRMRVAGSVIWSTDLAEHRQRSGGGKGKPKVTTYTYSSSFAVALSSRPIKGVGRIWADGNLLRGAAGDLKVACTFRLHTGEADQMPDPLIASQEGLALAPAFRGIAYAVFENLQLADFGNRIPTLSFEVFADEGPLSLATIVAEDLVDADAAVALPGLSGFSQEGALSDALAMLDPVWPLDCDACSARLTFAPERRQTQPLTLSEAAISVGDGDFGGAEGRKRQRSADCADSPAILRYYDVERDYQPGLQRSSGRAVSGQPTTIELPAALAASDARSLIESAARSVAWARETLSWRSAELDPAIVPGSIVCVPGEAGIWCVDDWEWRASGVELNLRRVSTAALAHTPATDPGRAGLPPDLLLAPTELVAFELPWDGLGGGDTPAVFAAVGSQGGGWNGAALFVDQGDGQLIALGPSSRRRAIIGKCAGSLAAASPHLFDRENAIDVELTGADLLLTSATTAQIAAGANRALVGEEIVQFLIAEPLGGARWRLRHLLRGRGGTEVKIGSHRVGESFVLLDDGATTLDPALIGQGAAAAIVAIGLGDEVAAVSPIALRGVTLQPLCPVHPRVERTGDGGAQLRWTRRARGAWLWNDGVDAPLHEQSEAYEVVYGPPEAPLARWDVTEPSLEVSAATLADLTARAPGAAFRVSQRGSYALSAGLTFPAL